MAGGEVPPQLLNFAFAPQARFKFNIDPKTPLKDLLPVPPQAEPKAASPLVEDLARVPEVMFQEPLARNLDTPKAMEQTALAIARVNHLNQKKSDRFMEALLETRPDLAGLPVAMGEACRTKGERSQQFASAVATVRASLGTGNVLVQRVFTGMKASTHGSVVFANGSGLKTVTTAAVPPPPVPAPQTAASSPANNTAGFWERYRKACDNEDRQSAQSDQAHREIVTVARIAALMQVLAPETPALRKGLVQYLAAVSHVEATRALARLALFSAEDDVRLAAIDALKVRRERDYTAILVQGLRYPWPAVARRASEALVKLERNDLVPQLVDLLDEADPRAPVLKEVNHKQVPVVRELVRINHHRNCLLCHAPGNTDGVSNVALTAAVPLPSQPLPSPSQGYDLSSPDILVRIDVTYLRQDFSMLLPVADANPWPEMQRFDFVVRTRVLTDKAAKAYEEALSPRAPGVLSPYHRAILAALRDLTGRDTAPTPQAWRRLLGLPAPARQLETAWR
jgi:hypothetical protein